MATSLLRIGSWLTGVLAFSTVQAPAGVRVDVGNRAGAAMVVETPFYRKKYRRLREQFLAWEDCRWQQLATVSTACRQAMRVPGELLEAMARAEFERRYPGESICLKIEVADEAEAARLEQALSRVEGTEGRDDLACQIEGRGGRIEATWLESRLDEILGLPA